MIDQTNHYSAQPDVAMFIDWENMHGFIRGKANISALREVAESHGRLVLAKAYADWRESRFQADSLVLYKIGFEPVYVPAGFKNNVDVKLATDCIDFAYKHPNIGVFLLVTGDGDFIHVVTALRPLGKKVIVIAQSSNASNRLGDLVDTLLIYDRDVEPKERVQENQGSGMSGHKIPKKPEELFTLIATLLKEEDGQPMLLSTVKDRLINNFGSFDQRTYGYDKMKSLLEAGAQNGYFVLNNAGLRDWLTLSKPNAPTKANELPNSLEDLLKTVIEIMKASNQQRVYLSFIKDTLIRRYGGFDEAVYGYGQFKELMEAGEQAGHFTLDVNEKQADFAVLKTA